jgi:FkbM family methyltransferase
MIARRFPAFNNPLLELVHQTHQARQAPLVVVDVGAGVGDTALLVLRNCPGAVKEFCCVEADAEFFQLLQRNLQNRPEVRLFRSLLSSSDGQERSLIRTHTGTASAQGAATVPAVTLDSLFASNGVDLIKTDVDGFDGKVLRGAKETLARCRPSGNNWTDHFAALREAGYSRFVWFNKFGEFSHHMETNDTDAVNRLAEDSIEGRLGDDWHYDVVALHEAGGISPAAIAATQFARNCRSRY